MYVKISTTVGGWAKSEQIVDFSGFYRGNMLLQFLSKLNWDQLYKL